MKISLRYSFIDFYLPLFMVLAQYSFAVSNVGTVILLAYTVLRVAARYNILAAHQPSVRKMFQQLRLTPALLWIGIFILYCSFMQLYHTVDDPSIPALNNLLMPLLYVVIVVIMIGGINKVNVYRSYCLFGIIAMLGMYYQCYGYYILDRAAVPITILPVAESDLHFWGDFAGSRPSSFFTEPQAYGSFVLPLLYLTMKRKSWTLSALLTLSIFLSTSSQGILLALLMWFVLVVGEVKGIFRKLAISLVAVGLIFIFVTSPIFQFSLEKIKRITPMDNVRISRGLSIFATFGWEKMLLGIGAGNLSAYVSENVSLFDWTFAYMRDQKEHLFGFYTGFFGALIHYGIGAGVLLTMLFYKMIRNDRENITFVSLYILTFFVQNMLFNSWFLFYTLIYFGACNNPGSRLSAQQASPRAIPGGKRREPLMKPRWQQEHRRPGESGVTT